MLFWLGIPIWETSINNVLFLLTCLSALPAQRLTWSAWSAFTSTQQTFQGKSLCIIWPDVCCTSCYIHLTSTFQLSRAREEVVGGAFDWSHLLLFRFPARTVSAWGLYSNKSYKSSSRWTKTKAPRRSSIWEFTIPSQNKIHILAFTLATSFFCFFLLPHI